MRRLDPDSRAPQKTHDTETRLAATEPDPRRRAGETAFKMHARGAFVLALALGASATNCPTYPCECGDQPGTVWKSKFNGAFLHAIDATLPRWRGDVGSSPLDGASTAVLSSRNDLVKNIVPEHTGRFPHRRLRERDDPVEVPGRRRQAGGRRELPPEPARRRRRPRARGSRRAGGLRAPRGLLAGAGRGL